MHPLILAAGESTHSSRVNFLAMEWLAKQAMVNDQCFEVICHYQFFEQHSKDSPFLNSVFSYEMPWRKRGMEKERVDCFIAST